MVTDGFALDGHRWICIGWSQMVTDEFVLDGHKLSCIGWSQMGFVLDGHKWDVYWMLTCSINIL
jgi:hypothetical protein